MESKVGSLANVKHKAGGGDKKVFNDVEYLRQTSAMHASSGASGSSSRRQSASQVREKERLRAVDTASLCARSFLSFIFVFVFLYMQYRL